MSLLQARIPDLLLQQVNELAANENVAVDEVVSAALAAHVSASKTRETIASRGLRVDWKNVDRILDRVPDVPPVPGNEL